MKRKKDEGYCAHLKSARMAIAEEQLIDALEFYNLALSSKDCGASVYYLKCELLFNIKHTFYVTSKHFEWHGKIEEAAFWWEKYQDLIHERDESSPNITKKPGGHDVALLEKNISTLVNSKSAKPKKY